MEYGGYLKVSEELGVRVRFETALEELKPFTLGGGDDEPETNLVMSAAAKEDRLAQQLQAMQARAAGTSDEGEESIACGATRSWQSSALPPLRSGAQAGTQATPSAGAKPSKAPEAGVPLLMLDGLQRTSMAALALLLSAGFGRSSAQMLDPGLSEALRVASLAFCIAHSAMAVYGGFLAAQSGESALAWFLKILFTGAGGLNEIKGVAARPAEQS